MNEVIDGINRRQAGTDPEYREAILDWLIVILQQNGLPGDLGSCDSDYLGWLAEIAELLERAVDAGEAGKTAEMHFIERQIDTVIMREKVRWGGSPKLIPTRITVE